MDNGSSMDDRSGVDDSWLNINWFFFDHVTFVDGVVVVIIIVMVVSVVFEFSQSTGTNDTGSNSSGSNTGSYGTCTDNLSSSYTSD